MNDLKSTIKYNCEYFNFLLHNLVPRLSLTMVNLIVIILLLSSQSVCLSYSFVGIEYKHGDLKDNYVSSYQ